MPPAIFARATPIFAPLELDEPRLNQTVQFPARGRSRHSLLLLLIALCVAALLLSACSQSGGHDTPTEIASPTSVPPPTLQAGQVTVGSLLARIAGSWAKVQSVRSEFATTVTGLATPGATPAASHQTRVVTEEIKPDRRRVLTDDNGATTEEIRIGDRIYMRGAYVTSMVAPNVGPTTWVTVDPRVVPQDSPVGQEIAYLTSPVAPPYQTVSDQMKQRAATPAGQVQVGDRTCTAYTFADVTPNGGKVDYTLAIDDQNMICSLTESAGAVQNLTTFTFNVPGLSITPPEIATPVAATPEG